MKAGSKKLFGAFVLCLVSSVALQATPYTFSTLPANGAIVGTAGSTVGWGYSVANLTSTDWLEFTNVGADPFSNGSSNAFVFNFPILAPGTSLTQAYDALNQLGLYEFTWDPGVSAGTSNSGYFLIDATWWDGDPFSSSSNALQSFQFSVPYSVTVSAASVPEPASLLLLGCGLGGLFLRRRRLTS